MGQGLIGIGHDEILGKSARGIRALDRKLVEQLWGRIDFLLSNAGCRASPSDCVLTFQKGAKFADSVDPFFSEDIINPGLCPHV